MESFLELKERAIILTKHHKLEEREIEEMAMKDYLNQLAASAEGGTTPATGGSTTDDISK